MAATLTRSGTMKCPHCHRVYRINANGTLRQHKIGSPHWKDRQRCHRRHHRTVRCLWCGAVKSR